MKRFVLAHDLGTTGNKASLYDGSGTMIGSAFSGYGTRFGEGGRAEQDPEDWWQAVIDSGRKLLADSGTDRNEIACIVFSGQMMGCVPIDRSGRPLANAIIWADTRAQPQQARLAERIDPQRVYRLSGHRLSASYSLCKILWLRDEEPELFARTHAFVQAKDAVVARLTGEIATDASDASGTNLYHLEGGGYHPAILEAAELDEARLPPIRSSTEVIAGVRPEIADEIGVASGTPVVIGGGDGACAALGAGVYREGHAYAYLGSSSWLATASQRPVYDEQARTFSWAHVVPGLYSPCGTMQAAGASYAWARDTLGVPEQRSAERGGGSAFAQLDALAAASPPGARGVLFLPYLLGERSPRWNPNARGAFVGLAAHHDRGDMLRAVLEGVAMNLRLILLALTAREPLERLRLIGGGARSDLWNRIMADMFELPVVPLAHLEAATSLGAAVVGGVAVGLYRDFAVVEQMNPPARTIEPDPEFSAIYRENYALFEDAYAALEPLCDRLGERP